MNAKTIQRLFVSVIVFSLSCNFATGLVGGGDPANFTAVLTSPDVVMLTWDAVEGATGYILELSIDKGDSFTIVALPPERTSYEDLTAPEKGDLTYQVQAVTESGPAGKSQVSIETGERQPNPLTVTPEYDEKNATTTVIGAQGGTASLIDSKGVEFTLSIPEGALSADTEIRMTAVTAVQDWPLDGNQLGAVRLEPEGLVLNDAAILTIAIPVEIDPDLSIVGFEFQVDGQEFHLQRSEEENGLTDILPSTGAHLASLSFQQPKRRIVLPVMELKVNGVGQATGENAANIVKDNAPSDSGAALEQKQAAENAVDGELTPLKGFSDPVLEQSYQIGKAIGNAENCKELNSQIVSFQKWRFTSSYQGMSDDKKRDYTKHIWDELTDKVKEILEKAATECEKSGQPGGSATTDSPCAKALLEKITNPPSGTVSDFNLELKNKLGNKLSDKELQDIKDKLEKCKIKVYTVSGTSGPVTFDGVVCIDKPFELAETFATGDGMVSFAPTSPMSGVVSDTSNSGGCEQSGIGNYVITLDEKGVGTLKWTITMGAECPPYTVTKPFSFELPLQPAPGLSCP